MILFAGIEYLTVDFSLCVHIKLIPTWQVTSHDSHLNMATPTSENVMIASKNLKPTWRTMKPSKMNYGDRLPAVHG